MKNHLNLITYYHDDVAIFFTNQVYADPNITWGDPNRHFGGHLIAHWADTRIYLRKGKDDRRIAILKDSSYLPPGEAVFKITQAGIIDV